MSDPLQQAAPVPTDNAAATPPAVPTEQTPPAQADNGKELTPEKREELSQKLNASKEEALRLKAERDQFAAEKAALQAQLEQQAAQQSQNNELPMTEQEVAIFKQLAEKAGVAFKPDVESIRNESLAEKNQKVLDSFLAEFPEYNKPGDPDSDKIYAELQGKLSFYRPASSPQELQTFLKEAHRARVANYNEQAATQRGEALGYAKANLQTQTQSGGGLFGGNSAPAKQDLSSDQQAVAELFKAVRPEYYKK